MNFTGTAPVIDATGIHAPTYAYLLDWLKGKYREIYGNDIYLEADSQDGQWLAILASAINDANSAAVAVYNAFSPATAQGASLSSNVKINGLIRRTPSNSTVDVKLTGQAGTTITNGVVRDSGNNRWALPGTVVIGTTGEVTVTATCQTTGSVLALPGEVSQIATPTLGWQTVSNLTAAAPGRPVETDAELRNRQANSVALPSLTVLDGIAGAISALPGVSRYRPYENDTKVTDANGIPGNSISLVVEGGDVTEIARTIALKKTPGAGTYGTTTEKIADKYGILHPISFFRPVDVAVFVKVELKALAGYSSSVASKIKMQVAQYIDALDIGETVYLARLYLPANLAGDPEGETFDIVSLTIGKAASSLAADNLVIAFNEAAGGNTDNVDVEVVT
ncbi:baseplate J/gp47 family protein (plasmid) [Erwinia tracheiphila]|uniref:baseplate J/gp47 family protein n=1 Tax=Erwinia tracheiphila TaxID=65700 RepID=UPI001F23196C|nr:baseplate J/gp47 family protein [Erwinia tracheiphila]UIA94535.1 baseplate J/gp47 family protein [Erwinia tracheiphila]